MPLQATSGAASYDAFGGGVPVVPTYIEDVFSTWLYTGNGSTQTINNGIDLAGKGGMTWIKQRSATRDNLLFDTTRGATQRLFSNLTLAQSQDTQSLTAFNANGFSIGSDSGCNINGGTYASWTFRKQPKFFDVVTYTGTGVNTTVSHNLNATVGFMLIKCTSQPGGWVVYHRSISPAQYLLLQTTDAATAGSGVSTPAKYWNSTAPTSTVFSLGDSALTNESGQTYVAYLFAHDAGGFGLTGTDNVISCGSFTGNTTVNLGYEPQWVLIKASSTTGNWQIIDNMRKWLGTDAASSSAEGGAFLAPNLSQAESNTAYNTNITPTGFKVDGISGTHIYIAIRRGPMRTPTSGTSVFSPNLVASDSNPITTGFPVDMFIDTRNNAAANRNLFDRLRGGGIRLFTNSTGVDDNIGLTTQMQSNTSVTPGVFGNSSIVWSFRRAPSVFDVVCYTGTGANRTVTHNLTVAPELMLVKRRSTVDESWAVYSATAGNTKFLRLNENLAATTSADRWNNTSPTSSVFTVGIDSEVNAAGETYVAYLFGSVTGVSKVGSYTGNGSNQTINCGFTGGARFVLIKRTDSTGDWYVWDTARGIVSGNDPHLSLNTTAAEVTGNDTIDPDSSGFIVNQLSATNVNVSSATYIYLAIA